jgi:hypothetical protein
MDQELGDELERRLALIETAGSGEEPLAPLPLADLLAAIVGLALLTVALLGWAL